METNYLNVASEKNVSRLNKKLGKLESKEMKQTVNEKTLKKHLSKTMQEITVLEYTDEKYLKEQFTKYVNFLSKNRDAALMGFDASIIKKSVTSEILFNNLDTNGLKKANCVSFIVGLLDKEVKEMKRKQEKQGAK